MVVQVSVSADRLGRNECSSYSSNFDSVHLWPWQRAMLCYGQGYERAVLEPARCRWTVNEGNDRDERDARLRDEDTAGEPSRQRCGQASGVEARSLPPAVAWPELNRTSNAVCTAIANDIISILDMKLRRWL